MASLKDELASLKIDQNSRAGGGRSGWIALVVLLLVAIGVGAGWFYTQRVQAAPVKTATVTASTGAGTAAGAVLNASGYVVARRRATVSSKFTGKVLEVFVEEGKAVKRGQVLARLDDSQLRAGLDVARAQLAAAKSAAAEDEARLREAERQFKRLSQLVQEKVVGRAEVDTAEATVESLKARIALARQQVEVAQQQVEAQQTDLNDTVVRAPFDGVAISKDAQPGEMISPVSAGGGFTRTGICTIVDMSSLEIEVDVSEQYINRVRPGQPVEALLDAYPDWRIPARVITTVPTADRQKATVRVRIGFEKLDPRILPDMGIKTSFLDERPADAPDVPVKARILVPKSAVRTDNGQSVVFVVRDDRVERRAVKMGAAQGDQVEVVSGLNSGERVVVDGHDSLTDGTRVKER
ncbi:MAG TPA: efflux RND transporter periplasmic adaptor subunit [Vicinamibacterales bacterium]